MTDYLGADRLDKLLDGILPPWRDKTGYRHRWTTPRGLFSVETATAGRLSAVCEFSGPTWAMTVPATVAGLDALVVAMVLAGAIELPREHGVQIDAALRLVRLTPQGGNQAPVLFDAAGAFAAGLKLIETAGHLPGWRAAPRTGGTVKPGIVVNIDPPGQPS